MSVTDDLSRLRHMRDAARKIAVFIEGENRQSLGEDEKLQLSLVRLVEIIGEAAARISDDLKEKYPQVPWQVITSMRNRLVHAYFAIDLDVVWDTVTLSVPALLEQIETILNQVERDA